MTYDRYKPLWPQPTVTPVEPFVWPATGTITTIETEASALEAFERLAQAAKELDAILGLPDCEDPSKATWLDSVKERVRQHELNKINDRLNK